MGRGQRGQAATEAKDLLYGRRRSLVRSAPEPLFPEPTSFAGLGQAEFLNNLINLTADLGLSKQLLSSKQKSLCQEAEPGPIQGLVTIDINQSDDHRLLLVVNTNSQEDKGIGAYYVEADPGASITLAPGDQLGDPENSRVDQLRAKCQDLGVQRFGYRANPEQIVRRLKNGDPIELDSGRNVLSSKNEAEWPRIKSHAKHLIHLAYNDEIISGAEEASLAGLMDSLNQGDHVLAKLASDPAGREVIRFCQGPYVTEELNP